MSNDNQKPQMK